MSAVHTLYTMETCPCGGVTGNCPVCDYGFSICMYCGCKDVAPGAVCSPRPTLAAALKEWRALVGWLNMAKGREQSLRLQLIGTLFPNGYDLPAGTHRADFVDGRDVVQLKASRSSRNELLADKNDDENAPKTFNGLQIVVSTLPADLQAGLITWEPKLDGRKFAALPDEAKKRVAQFVSQKPNMPALEIIS